MFGSIGVPELILVFVVALLLFGPRKLPEIGRTIGKALGEFRRASNDLKRTIEEEVATDELRQAGRELRDATRSPVSLADLGGSSQPPPAAEEPASAEQGEATVVVPAEAATNDVSDVVPEDVAEPEPVPEDAPPPAESGDTEERT